MEIWSKSLPLIPIIRRNFILTTKLKLTGHTGCLPGCVCYFEDYIMFRLFRRNNFLGHTPAEALLPRHIAMVGLTIYCMQQSGTIGILRAEHTPELSFRQWVWYVRENRLYLLLCAGLMLIQFMVFKSLFPNPDFLPESYAYLEIAAADKDISIWPVGYAKFLRLGGVFTYSATSLVLFQYLLLQLSILYFIFTLTYFLRPGKIVTVLLFFIGVINPLLLHVSNLISSDALFAALSICWATQLLWIMKGARMPLLIIHALLLLLVFTLSYNALYYPVISMVIIAISRYYILFKLAANLLIFVFIGGCIIHTVKAQRETGTQQTMYTYAHIAPESPPKIPSRLRPLQAVIGHMDSLRQVRVWQWSAMAPLYGSYGAYAMWKYPGLYVKYYLLPNLITFYVPEEESLDGIAIPYTLIIALSNLGFLTGCIIFFVINGFKRVGHLYKILLGAFILWLANGMFSVMAGPVVLRYQVFPMIISAAFSLIMIEYFINAANADDPPARAGGSLL